MQPYVLTFCLAHAVQLQNKLADDFRPLQQSERPGTFYHRSLPLGDARDGVTNGVIAFVLFRLGDQQRLVHVAHSNLEFEPDEQEKNAQEREKSKPSIFAPREFTTQHEFWLAEQQELKRKAQKTPKAKRVAKPVKVYPPSLI